VLAHGAVTRSLTLDDLLSDPLPIDGCVCIHTKQITIKLCTAALTSGEE